MLKCSYPQEKVRFSKKFDIIKEEIKTKNKKVGKILIVKIKKSK